MELDTKRANSKLICVEFIRFVSAFSVLIWHYQHFSYAESGFDLERASQPFYDTLSFFYVHGASGVQVFWCLSGFIFFYNYYSVISQRLVNSKTFFVNRFSRLYPLHFVTLLIVSILQTGFVERNGYFFVYQFNDLKHFVLNLFFISEWGFQDGASFNAPIWSVSLEVIVYILFFVLIRAFSLYVAFTLAAAISTIVLVLGNENLAGCIVYFFCGGAIALCKYYPTSVIRMWSFPVSLNLLVGISLLSLTFVFSGISLFVSEQFYVILKLCIICTIVYGSTLLNRPAQRFSKEFIFLGNLTYSSYLLHIPIQLLMVLIIPLIGFQVDYKSPQLLILYLLITFASSAVSFRYIEMPSQKYLRNRLR